MSTYSAEPFYTKWIAVGPAPLTETVPHTVADSPEAAIAKAEQLDANDVGVEVEL